MRWLWLFGFFVSIAACQKAAERGELGKQRAEVDRAAEAERLTKTEADLEAKAERLTKAEADLDAKAERLTKAEADLDAKVQSLSKAEADSDAIESAVAAVEQEQWNIVRKLPPAVLANLPSDVLATIPPVNLQPFKNSIGMSFKLLAGELSGPFSIGRFEVTQSQYEQVMGCNPSEFKDAENPVENVSWDDAVEYCRRLSELPDEKAAGRVYVLPTVDEWLYAFRGGTKDDYSFENGSKLAKYAWFRDNSGEKLIDSDTFWKTVIDWESYSDRGKAIDAYIEAHMDKLRSNKCQPHPVGKKLPNGWGLYDMRGNVSEWCEDLTRDGRVLTGSNFGDGTTGYSHVGISGIESSFRSALIGFRLTLRFPSDHWFPSGDASKPNEDAKEVAEAAKAARAKNAGRDAAKEVAP